MASLFSIFSNLPTLFLKLFASEDIFWFFHGKTVISQHKDRDHGLYTQITMKLI